MIRLIFVAGVLSIAVGGRGEGSLLFIQRIELNARISTQARALRVIDAPVLPCGRSVHQAAYHQAVVHVNGHLRIAGAKGVTCDSGNQTSSQREAFL